MTENPYFDQEFNERPFNGIRKCRVCQKIGNVKYCQLCKLEGYCSKEHQLERWRHHKEFCKLVGKLIAADQANSLHEIIRHREKIPEPGAKQLQTAILLLQEKLPRLLGRKMSFDEMMLVMHPSFCLVCYTTDKKKLTDCLRCLNVSYCKDNPNCKEKYEELHRPDICDAFRIQLLINEHAVGDAFFRHKIPRAGSYDLSSGGTFELLEYLTGKTFTRSPYSEQEQKEFVQVSQFSCTATILYSFYLCNLLDMKKWTLTIHIVGAHHEYDYFGAELSSIIFAFMPNIRCLNYILVGPQLHRKSTEVEKSFEGRTVKIQLVQKFYEKYKAKEKPDLIICYNSGFTETNYCPENTWIAGVRAVLKHKHIPIAFTSYVEYERADDLEFIQRVAADYKIPLEEPIYTGRNPYKDYRPVKGYVSEIHGNELFYGNNFLTLYKLT